MKGNNKGKINQGFWVFIIILLAVAFFALGFSIVDKRCKEYINSHGMAYYIQTGQLIQE